MGASLSLSRWKGQYTKRKRPASEDFEDDSDWEVALRTPKRKKLMTTSQYIFNKLFLEGQNSDVTIGALGFDWNLHKVYLCQSPYFASMFHGDWKEKEECMIDIGIEDPRITIESLKVVFGSLYLDEISVEPVDVISVLATATLFQLDGVIQQCIEIMEETLSVKTVLPYYEAAEQYAMNILAEKCFQWLERNLMYFINESPMFLLQISPSLMEKLISSSSLNVVQTEFSVYMMLSNWMFLQENSHWEGDPKECCLQAHKHFQSRKDKPSFLETEDGEKYAPAFRRLRFSHLINHHLDVEMLESDNVVPKEWLYPVFRNQWYAMLRIDQGLDKGPKSLSEDDFNHNCLRCGRILNSDSQHIWRWTGYNYGLDLVVTYHGRTLRFRRNTRSDIDITRSSTQSHKRNLFYRVSLYSSDGQGGLKYLAGTGLTVASLSRNEEIRVLSVDQDFKFPLLISANFMVTTPVASTADTGNCKQS